MTESSTLDDVAFGHFQLQPAARQLLVEGRPAKLGGRAFDLLVALVEHRERAVSKDELLDRVWPGLVVEENNLQVHISCLRKLLGPAAIATIPGRGYRFTALPTAAQATPAQRHNLPRQRNRFIGREDALADGERLLQGTRLLTFTGLGGCGKTRLALQLAHARLGSFADGVWFVDLAPLQEPKRVPLALAAVFEVSEEAGTPLLARLAARLASREALIVLDNCEHVIDAVAETADSLLTACADLKIIATSRERLGVAGEQLYPVPPLSLPDSAEPEALEASEAARLFVDRAGLALPSFAVDARNAAGIGEICRRLDGIPLAIELAAARVKMLPVTEIAARLDDRFRFLTNGDRAPARHQTLQATLQWSHDSLSPAEQRLFRELAVFAGGCTLESAAQVADSADDYALLALLTQLHDKSLLVADLDRTAKPRYRMLDTVREYALARLGEAQPDAVRQRHLRCCVALAETALQQMQGPRQGACMAMLRLEQENLLAAHAWCRHAPRGDDALLRLAGSLWRYWVASAQLERGHALAQQALEGAGAHSDPLWHCRALWAAGQLAFRIGRYAETLERGETCLATARSIDDREQIAAGLVLRGGGLYATGQLVPALAALEEARDIGQTLGVHFGLVAAHHGLAEVHRSLGRPGLAEGCYEDAIAVARALEDPRATAVPLCNLARLLVVAGKRERARSVLLESLALAAEAGLKGLGEQVLDVSAGFAASLEDHLAAARFSGAALACMHESGSRRQPVDQAFVAPLIARSLNALGPAAFTIAEAGGQALSYGEATREVEAWLVEVADRP